MAQKRIQVFVSSTFLDLKEERQAVVEAILAAGHMPAGMELFAAGSESQLETIYRWIDDSDAFVIILGTRYGSIEPKTGRSYVELEYDRAESAGKELFALVLDEQWQERKVKDIGSDAIDEKKWAADFRARVLSKTSSLCSNIDQLKFRALAALNDITRKDSVRGWISSADAKKLELEIEALKAAAAALKSRAAAHAEAEATGGGEKLDAMCAIMKAQTVEMQGFSNVLDVLIAGGPALALGISWSVEVWRPTIVQACPLLVLLGLVEVEENRGYAGDKYSLTESGRAIVAYLFARRAGVTLVG